MELDNFCSREHPLREVINSHFSESESVYLIGRARQPGKKTWDILGYGFQDMVFKTWDLNFGAWEILGYDFQDMVFKT
jgi:hypothetical protein